MINPVQPPAPPSAPATKPVNINHLKHAYVDMSDKGIGPQRVCTRCGVREGTRLAHEICQPSKWQPPMGAKSEYDPTAT